MAKFKVGDRVNDSGTWGKIVAVLKKSASGETLYAFAPESGPAKGHAYEILEGKLSLNSRVCNSSNPVVRKAMNAVAMNAKSIDKWEFDIMLRSRIGDNGKGAEDYMRQNREQIEKDIGKDGFRKLCSKFGNTLAYNARNTIVRKAMNASTL